MILPEDLFSGIRRFFARQEGRGGVWIPVPLAVGIALRLSLFPAVPITLMAGVAGVAGAGTFLSRRHFRAFSFCLGIFLVAAGFLVAAFRMHTVAAPVLAREIGPVSISGTVLSVSETKSRRRLLLDAPEIGRLSPEKTPQRVRISASAGGAESVAAGDHISTRAMLMPPPLPAMPGAFSFARKAWFKKLGGIGYVVGRVELKRGKNKGLPETFKVEIEKLRRRVARRVRSRISGEAGIVAAALVTGKRQRIPESLFSAYRDSGLAHVLSISGLHMTLVAGLFFLAFRLIFAAIPRLVLNYPVRKWSAGLAILASLGYFLLSGMRIPTQRAFIMTTLVLVAVLIDRRAISIRLVATAAFFILLFQPESLLSAGFQMSFAAVAALVALYEDGGARRRLSAFRHKAGRGIGAGLVVYVGGVLLTDLVASSATAPFVLFHFNRVSAYTLLANLVVAPVLAFWVMPVGLLSMILMPLGADGPFLTMMGQGTGLMNTVATWVSGLPGSVMLVEAFPPVALLLFGGGMVWLCLVRGPGRWIGAGLIAAGLISGLFFRPPDLLVGEDGELVAVRDAQGALHMAGESDGFVPRMWLSRNGQAKPLPLPFSGKKQSYACDAGGCVLRGGDRRVALVRVPEALGEACRQADAVFHWETGAECPPGTARFVGQRELEKYGTHALWLAPFEIRGAGAGKAPWVNTGAGD